MSTETLNAKPIPVSNLTVSEKNSPHLMPTSPSSADKPQPAHKTPAELAAAAAQAKPEVLRLLLEDLASPDRLRRATAAAALGRMADVAAVPPLIAALRDPDADVARNAAASLGSLGNPAAVDPLIAVVDNPAGFFHVGVRIAATHSLGQLPTSAPSAIARRRQEPHRRSQCRSDPRPRLDPRPPSPSRSSPGHPKRAKPLPLHHAPRRHTRPGPGRRRASPLRTPFHRRKPMGRHRPPRRRDRSCPKNLDVRRRHLIAAQINRERSANWSTGAFPLHSPPL